MKKVFIDIGHGGEDSGAIGRLFNEKEYNLIIGNKVIDKLKNYNCEVFYSRNTDKTVSLEDRVKLSDKYNCDIFVSIHCNSSPNTSATGFESFSYNGNSELQNRLHKEVIKDLPLVDRGMKTANFYVLRETNAKAVLLELGFISNLNDSGILNANVESVANSIVRGIILYLGLSQISSNREVYRVCVGSYTVRANAENMLKQLEKDGYKPFIAKATI